MSVIAARAVAGSSAEPGMLSQALRRSGFTGTGVGLLAFSVCCWILARVIGGEAVYLIAYVGVCMAVSAVVIARRRRSLQAERSRLPLRAREGQMMEVELTLTAGQRLTGFVVQEDLHPLLGAAVRLPVSRVAPDADVTLHYTFRPALRGVYDIGPLSAEWTDPFGIARREQPLAAPARLIVHPRFERLVDRPLTRLWEDPPMRPPLSKPWPAGSEFYGLRDYVPGDDLRRVVWRAVARTGKMLVREAEQGITDRMVVVLDTDRSWHSPGDVSESFEYAVRVAASVGSYHLDQGYVLSVFSNESRLAAGLRGPQAQLRYLDQLAGARISAEPLTAGLERLLREGRTDAHTVVVTPRLDPRSAARLGLLIDSGASVLVVVIAWEEADLASVRRATEVGAQVVELKPGATMGPVFAQALGTGRARL